MSTESKGLQVRQTIARGNTLNSLADDEATLNYFATLIAREFDFSVEVIAKRLHEEKDGPTWS